MACPECGQKMTKRTLSARGSNSWDCVPCNLVYIKRAK